MSVINSKAGLFLTGFIFAVFSLMQIIAPIWFVKQYKVDLNDSTKFDLTAKLISAATIIFIGICYMIGAAVNSLNLRQGSDASKSTLCFMNGLYSVLNLIMAVVGMSHWEALGVKAGSIYFNMGLFATVALVNFLSVDGLPKIDLAPMGNRLYWGFFAVIVLFTLYFFGMVFFAEKLLSGYGIEFTGDAQKFLVGCLKYSLAPFYFYMVLVSFAQIITCAPQRTYIFARVMAIMSFAVTMAVAVWAAVWTALNVNGKYDKMISGQYFNMAIWFILFLLFYVGVASMDSNTKNAVEEAVVGEARELESEESE